MKNIILLNAFVFMCIFINAQSTVSYLYDLNGNRIQRKVTNKKVIKADSLKVDTNQTIFDNSIEDRILTNISIHPNPTTGRLIVDITQKSQPLEATIDIINLFSQVMLHSKIETFPGTIDICNFKPGIYICQIRLDNQLRVWKVIKQ